MPKIDLVEDEAREWDVVDELGRTSRGWVETLNTKVDEILARIEEINRKHYDHVNRLFVRASDRAGQPPRPGQMATNIRRSGEGGRVLEWDWMEPPSPPPRAETPEQMAKTPPRRRKQKKR